MDGSKRCILGNKVLHEEHGGWLSKKSGIISRWRRFWCVLDFASSTIQFRSAEENGKLYREIEFEGDTAIHAVRVSSAPIGADHEIEVITKKRTLRFFADDPESMDLWIQAFRQAAHFFPPNTIDAVQPTLMSGMIQRCAEDGSSLGEAGGKAFKGLAARESSGWVFLNSDFRDQRDKTMAINEGTHLMQVVLRPLVFNKSGRREHAGAGTDDLGTPWVKSNVQAHNPKSGTGIHSRWDGASGRYKLGNLQTKVTRWNEHGMTVCFKFNNPHSGDSPFVCFRAEMQFMRQGHPIVAPLAEMFEKVVPPGSTPAPGVHPPQFWSQDVISRAAPWVPGFELPCTGYGLRAIEYAHRALGEGTHTGASGYGARGAPLRYNLEQLRADMTAEASIKGNWYTLKDVEEFWDTDAVRKAVVLVGGQMSPKR